MTKDVDNAYWKAYYDFWDKFVGNWLKEREKKHGVEKEYTMISMAYDKAVAALKFDELPTPYLGKPHEKIKAVILNMNPGLSETIGFGRFAGMNSDETQFYRHIDNEIGWLIREFKKEAHGLYSSFVGIGSDINYSCLNPDLLDTEKYPDWVCGVNWWQGYDKKLIERDYRKKCFQNRDKRMPWLRQIYNNKNISPAEVFALEFCPYHSEDFDFESRKLDNNAERNSLLNFIADNVIHPALVAVFENKELPFAVAIGKPTAIFLEQQLNQIKGGTYGIEAKLEREWWEESAGAGSWNWPKTRDRATAEMRLAHRKYCLFALKDKDGRLARFLVTAAPGGLTTPSEDFEKIEGKLIRDYVRNNKLTEEFYKRILPLEKMCWWKKSKDKAVSSKANPKQKGPQKRPEPVSVPNQDKTQLYKNLWTVFSEWCRKSPKDWIKPKYDKKVAKVFYPTGKLPYLFKIHKNQLCLGIYCSVKEKESERIRRDCEKEFSEEFKGMVVDWGNQKRSGNRTILFPISDDWRNLSEALFEKMANTFESVRDILRDKGFLR